MKSFMKFGVGGALALTASAAHAQYTFAYSGGRVIEPVDAYLNVYYGFGGNAQFDTATGNLDGKPYNSGWYDAFGSNIAGNDNYIAGSLYGDVYRDYFSFDTYGLYGYDISGLSVAIWDPLLNGVNGGTNGPGIFKLGSVSTPASLLNTNNGSAAIFNDLGSGSFYGSLPMSPANNGSYVTIWLGGSAISDLLSETSQQGYFSVAGSYTSTTTPGPEAALVMGAAFAGLLRRRRAKS